MITRIIMYPPLNSDLQPKIERQLDLSLASLHSLLVDLKAELVSRQEQNPNKPIYNCRLEVRLRNGGRQCVDVSNSNLQACITDAAERMRRSVIREQKSGLHNRVR